MKLAKTFFSTVLVIAIVVVSIVAVNSSQDISDWWRLRGYTAPEEIAALAKATNMTEEGKKLFYVYEPALLSDKKQFRDGCSSFEATIVLGCYVSKKGLFIYDVNDDRLTGIEEVTAAHEMLHVAYERLPKDEKNRVNVLLNEVYNTLDDERLLATINSYKDEDQSVITNELHSILGTELRKLPQELEDYYRKYFSSRIKIVEMSEKYEKEFSKRKKQIDSYDKQLETLKSSISRLQADLALQAQALKQERDMLENLRNNTSAYNAGVSSYNDKVSMYNIDVATLKKDVASYNKIVGARNKIALEEKDLVDSLDTSIDEL